MMLCDWTQKQEFKTEVIPEGEKVEKEAVQSKEEIDKWAKRLGVLLQTDPPHL